jgi:predicted  nucleic acid-binding Zn-ribbon protein
MLNPLLRELHRLRKHIRDAHGEIERGPKVLKLQQAKLAAQEKTLADAKEELKKRKAGILTGEAQIKSLNQALNKHEKQLNDLTALRDIEAKQHDIANTKTLIAHQEDEVLAAMGDVDERMAKMSDIEAATAKAKADFATYERDAVERMARLKEAVAEATKALVAEESKIPPGIRGRYDRLVKAHGADALAPTEGTSCSHCRVGITAQHFADLQKSQEFFCCRNCGRALYIPA